MRRFYIATLPFCRFVIPSAALLLTVSPAYAQGTTIVQPQAVPYLELLVTGVLAGMVVFVVCRSSRRN